MPRIFLFLVPTDMLPNVDRRRKAEETTKSDPWEDILVFQACKLNDESPQELTVLYLFGRGFVRGWLAPRGHSSTIWTRISSSGLLQCWCKRWATEGWSTWQTRSSGDWPRRSPMPGRDGPKLRASSGFYSMVWRYLRSRNCRVHWQTGVKDSSHSHFLRRSQRAQ